MRLWSVHPRYLDAQGLVAIWREALLARAVLRGATKGYRHHPQLERFRAHASPRYAICAYLSAIQAEAYERYKSALTQLSPKDRELIVARVEIQWTVPEIAQRFGMRTVDAARMAVSRAVRRLTQQLHATQQ